MDMLEVIPSVHVFIISWTGMHENSIEIAQKIKTKTINNRDVKVTIIYSDIDDAITLQCPFDIIKVSNDWYWGKKFEACLKLCDADILLQIQGDCSCDDWGRLVTQCVDQFTQHSNLGVWAPLVDYTYLDLDKCSLGKLNDECFYVVNTDGIVFGIPQSTQSRLKKLNYDQNKYGWGIDMASCVYAYTHDMFAIVDSRIQVNHPKSRGYSSEDAEMQMHEFFKQLTINEQAIIKLSFNYIHTKRIR